MVSSVIIITPWVKNNTVVHIIIIVQACLKPVFFYEITIIQPQTIWEDKLANFKKIDQIIANLSEVSDIVVLPEMFTTGFTLNAEMLAEEFNGKTLKWMSDLSEHKILQSAAALSSGLPVNFITVFLLLHRHGNFLLRQTTSFQPWWENEIFTSGKTRQVINYKGIRFLPIICYDLRFPVWCRNREIMML